MQWKCEVIFDCDGYYELENDVSNFSTVVYEDNNAAMSTIDRSE